MGPNGTGKSNLIAAYEFVMMEGGRFRKKQVLKGLVHQSPVRKAEFAEVKLVFARASIPEMKKLDPFN